MTIPVPPAPPPPSTSSIATSNFNTTYILNRIFSLILGMVSSLQNAAASQAHRLTFMSQWQASYTDAMGQVHTFTQGGGGAFSGAGSTAAAQRDDANRLNSGFIQTLQNRQSVVSDNAKALQSNINQSNDAVNQQSNLGTAILQELGTLLGIIFK